MFKKLFGTTCGICKKKTKSYQGYLNDDGKPIDICLQCVPYAERRALRKA
ncbi:hypothetical protein [Texcoconibacillus texcoconensis]|uniref:Uncharacterized protein n=1 Tax=Texcoconibacillus texcoconensis TaxID=1095777 RepID=A0A840QSN0_9BACI|nr:hypothetical protein [Texcoconibacillus texcoconensis]MBB5174277.1 hypothetical protein [Texcoconibacillus texcoconensis]